MEVHFDNDPSTWMLRRQALSGNVVSTPRTRIQSWARITCRRARKDKDGPYSAEELPLEAEWVARRDATKKVISPADDPSTSATPKVVMPSSVSRLEREEGTAPPMHPKRLLFDAHKLGALPSRRERADEMRELQRWMEMLDPAESLQPRPAQAWSPALEPTRADEPNPSVTRPPGTTPSSKEFKTIALAWSRARTQSCRLLSSPSN